MSHEHVHPAFASVLQAIAPAATSTTPLDLAATEPYPALSTTGESRDQVQPTRHEEASRYLAQYRSFADSLSMSYRKRAELLGFEVEPKEVAHSDPTLAPIRCWYLTRYDSIHSWQIIEENMYAFLEGWEEAMKHVHRVPFAAQYGEAP